MVTAVGSRSLFFAVMFAVTVAADDGDDFANNLFSDLAPLLALFGERVTMQYVSQSLGWADNIILAMVPLGIITIITSAIRVGGPSFLKALIGRAREDFAVAEQELMSSTSEEVCDLWNGHEIVRCVGSCPVEEFIRLLPKFEEGGIVDVKVKTFNEVLEEQLIQNETNLRTSNSGISEVEENGLRFNKLSSSTIIVTRNPFVDTPNISLNSHHSTSRFELRMVAVLGTILQFAVLVFSACAVYHPALKFSKDGNPVAVYSFPCYIIGTLLLVTGMLLCAHVIESSTIEGAYRPMDHVSAHLVWLQQTKAVNDQKFDSYAVYAKSERSVITASRRSGRIEMTRSDRIKTKQDKSRESSMERSDRLTNQQSATDVTTYPQVRGQVRGRLIDYKSMFSKVGGMTDLELETCVGTIADLCGFIVQFVGLRGLHWSASIAQLGAVLLMAGLKAWVCRGLAEHPLGQRILPNFELDWFATTFADAKHAPWRPDGDVKETQRWQLERLGPTKKGLELHDEPQTDNRPISGADRVVKIRRDLAQLASWHGPASVEAVAIARSIEATMDTLIPSPSPKFLNCTWALESPTQGEVRFRLHRANGKWQAYADEIEAALSLWLFSVSRDEDSVGTIHPDELRMGDAQDDKWLRTKRLIAKNSLRILGPYSQSLHRDLSWWVPRETTKIIRISETKYKTHPAQILSVRNHRIVGSKESFRALGGQTIFKVEDLLGPRFGLDDYEKSEDSDSENGEHDIGYSTAAQRKDDFNQNFLAVECNGSLESLFALDIFSGFWAALVRTLERSPFTELAEIHPNHTSNGTWKSFSLRSEKLMKLVKIIQSTGLGSLDDIYLSMIPALSAENKLPQVTRVIGLTRQHAEPHEKLQRWDEASDAYLWLFRVAKTFPKDNEFVAQAVAILVEFLRQVNSALDLCETLEDERRKTLKPLKKKIESELRNGGKIEEIFDILLSLYTTQQRPWKATGVSQATNYEFPFIFNLTPMHMKVLKRGVHLSSSDIEKDKRDLNTKDVLGWAPLHYVVGQGVSIEQVFSTVKSELAVSSQDLLGHTPLHWACGMKYEDRPAHSSIPILLQNIRTLLEWGAEINAQGRDGVAPIHCAAKSGNLQATRFLVESSANIDIQDASRKTPLLWSVVGGNQATVEYLWENANRKLRDGEGRTALHLAVVFADDGTVAWLLEHGADARAVDRRTRTPLHQSGQTGRLRATQLLYQRDKAGVNAKDAMSYTPLYLAARAGHKAVAEWLIKTGADVNAKDHRNRTLLHIAAEADYRAVMRWLIRQGKADVNARDGLDRTPLHLAAENGHEAVVKWLVQEAGADVNAKDGLNRTPLHLAAENGHEAVVKWLVQEAGADMNANYDRTPLHLAAENGHVAVVKWLAQEAGADVSMRDSRGRTASHLAAENGHEAVVKWLAQEAGAYVSMRDSRGRTASHLAAENGHEAVVKWLVQEAGADVSMRDSRGRTASHLAAENGYEALREWLIEEEARAVVDDRESV